jgi:hypothetical protein
MHIEGAIMKNVIIFYSLTGNNEALALNVAKVLGVDNIKITELKSRNMGKIATDVLFNKIPQVNPVPEKLENYDEVLFFGPIWMGQLASPLRAYLKYLKTNVKKYAFISISGGAEGPNPKIENELIKRVGKDPVAVINLYIADLLPSDPKPTRNDTMAYRLKDEDIINLTQTAVKEIKKFMTT